MRNYKTDLFQRRHYEWIAETIHDICETPLLRENLAMLFANKMTHTNPQFDRERFIKACIGE